MILDWVVSSATRAIESGRSPDWATRAGIRYLCRKRLISLQATQNQQTSDSSKKESDSFCPPENDANGLTEQFVLQCSREPIAVSTADANEQHYELPPGFFELFLGPHRKYSCCHWPDHVHDLANAETASLQQVCERAQISDGMNILELGCGWGSLTLWMLRQFPNVRMTAVSNSSSQREYITSTAKALGYEDRLTVITSDMNSFNADAGQFDRVVSLEMFEHMRNHQRLLGKIRGWLKTNGKLFVHIFCHRDTPYLFQAEGAANWMGRYFFTGGMMPSFQMFQYFPEQFTVQQQWKVNGKEYSKTLEAWLVNFDRNRVKIDEILADVYGESQVTKWRNRWRIFLLACSELFGYGTGDTWFVGHYLMSPVR